MERDESHTRHCRSCSGALQRLRQLRRLCVPTGVAGLAAAAWLGAGPAALAALLLVGVALALHAQCSSWIDQMQQGSGLPPRNRTA
jgi:hypothetical protein